MLWIHVNVTLGPKLQGKEYCSPLLTLAAHLQQSPPSVLTSIMWFHWFQLHDHSTRSLLELLTHYPKSKETLLVGYRHTTVVCNQFNASKTFVSSSFRRNHFGRFPPTFSGKKPKLYCLVNAHCSEGSSSKSVSVLSNTDLLGEQLYNPAKSVITTTHQRPKPYFPLLKPDQEVFRPVRLWRL